MPACECSPTAVTTILQRFWKAFTRFQIKRRGISHTKSCHFLSKFAMQRCGNSDPYLPTPSMIWVPENTNGAVLGFFLISSDSPVSAASFAARLDASTTMPSATSSSPCGHVTASGNGYITQEAYLWQPLANAFLIVLWAKKHSFIPEPAGRHRRPQYRTSKSA